MKRIITAFLFFVLVLPVCKAQGTSPEDRYKSFQAYKKEYLKKQIGLTDKEAAHFFPLYDEMQLKKYRLNRQRGEAYCTFENSCFGKRICSISRSSLSITA